MNNRQNQLRQLWLQYNEAVTDTAENPPATEVELETKLGQIRGAWMAWQALVCQGVDPSPETII